MMSLPLLESGLARESNLEINALCPGKAPGPGEQYGFHFDMSKCIGCKCCVVACNEQNGNPAEIQWRRVGEVEGGHFPFTQRHYLSMGCNHCLEPSCLIGCPVEAYTKSPLTGVVAHNADTCIGCQYCVWNCSFGVPQYNAERGTVGKCDLCHNRLSDGMAPACVNACPEGAIAVEIVNIAQWKADYNQLDTPGLPAGEDCVSTTRITLPESLPPDLGRVDTQRIEMETPHWPLVFMLVLTQLAAGALAGQWLSGGGQGAYVAVGIAMLSLAASTLHLGRPIHAWRALRNLKRSWLSREVLFLGLFALAGAVYAFAPSLPVAFSMTLSAAVGIYCSARLYMVPARPAWNHSYTLAEFFATALLLGPALLLALGGGNEGLRTAWLIGIGLQMLTQAMKFLWLARSEEWELRAASLLLSGRLRRILLARMALLMFGALTPFPVLAFALGLASELMGRWLFFVSVVPRNMAAAFTGSRRAA
jgi:formate dehydrogenase iron-sulfur subunit